jgi:hypothetical protein
MLVGNRPDQGRDETVNVLGPQAGPAWPGESCPWPPPLPLAASGLAVLAYQVGLTALAAVLEQVMTPAVVEGLDVGVEAAVEAGLGWGTTATRAR